MGQHRQDLQTNRSCRVGSFGEILGLVAGAITTGSFVPQVVVFKVRSAHEISLAFILAFVVGDSAWLVYGIYFQLFPVIFWNVLAIGSGSHSAGWKNQLRKTSLQS